MKDPHHVNHIVADDSVVQRMRSNGVFSVAGANMVAVSPDSRISHDPFDSALNFTKVGLSLLVVPAPKGIVPDLF